MYIDINRKRSEKEMKCERGRKTKTVTDRQKERVFEMAAMPFPCNGHLLCLCEFTYSFANVVQ